MNKKNFQSLLIALFVIGALLTGCVKGDFDEPPINIPDVKFESNRTIAELKATYTGLAMIEDSIIIQGIVCANDESGNLYKKIEIQDKTGGIELALDKTSLYNEYKVGQRIFVKCQGMYIGDYNNLIQLGGLYNGAIGRLPEVEIANHLFPDSLPGNPPTPKSVGIGELSMDMVSTLVKLENVHFETVGQEFAPQGVSATNRNIIDAAGNTLIIRTSSYANFATKKTPSGVGTVVGVLSVYQSDYQLTVRDTNDLIGFKDTIIDPPNGEGTGVFDDPYNCAYVMAGTSEIAVWVQGYIVGVYETTVDPFAPNFVAPFATNSNMLIADSPDETNLSACLTVQLPAGDIRTALNLVDNAANKGKQVKILGNLEAYFSQPGVKGLTGYWMDGTGIIPITGFFTEEFASDLGTFTGISVSGAQTWGHANYDGGCAKMSGYESGTNNANEDWLISGAISLAGKTGVKLSFREAINYITSIEDAKVLISTNYTGNGDPSSATWDEVTGFTRSPGNSWTFVDSGEVPLTQYEGQTIYIAFKYVSSASDGATWEVGRVLLTAAK